MLRYLMMLWKMRPIPTGQRGYRPQVPIDWRKLTPPTARSSVQK